MSGAVSGTYAPLPRPRTDRKVGAGDFLGLRSDVQTSRKQAARHAVVVLAYIPTLQRHEAAANPHSSTLRGRLSTHPAERIGFKPSGRNPALNTGDFCE